MSLDEVKICLGTMGSILIMIENMESPSIKKLKKAIKEEMEIIEGQLKKLN